MASFNPPTIGQPNSTEDQDIVNGLTVLDNLLDASDLVPNAGLAGGIAHSKLASGTPGQLLLFNGSSVATATTMSGDATISSAGALTLAANSVGTAEITDANVTDAKLASPNNSVYRAKESADGYLSLDAAADTYLLGSAVGPQMLDSGTALDFAAVGAPDRSPPHVFYLDDADYTVASKTTKLRIRAQVLANATAPAINFTFGLHVVTVAGAADNITYTAAAAVAGSTAVITTPSASTPTSAVGSDFDVPADGHYLLAVVTSGALANNSGVSCHAQLQMRHT